MKISKIITIFKSGAKNSLDNYRPISLLPAFSKLLEKIVAQQLVKFIDKYNIIYEHQYGFRKKHSTIHPILHITLGLFLYLSKAFDTISHPILLHKLNYYGIRGVCNDWFRSYLTNRKQCTETYSKSSSYASMTCGVPQGSLLFLIYINDIQNCTSLDLLSFADDTTVYSSHSNITQLFNNMNKELNELTDWFYANKLSLNVNKTKYTIFTPNRNISDPHNETNQTKRYPHFTRELDQIPGCIYR